MNQRKSKGGIWYLDNLQLEKWLIKISEEHINLFQN